MEPSNPILGGAFGDGVFAAASSDAKIYTSPDGVVWTLRFTSGSGGVYDPMIYNGSMFLGFADAVFSDFVAYSADGGVTWTEAETIGDSTTGAFRFQFGYQYGSVVWDSTLRKFFGVFRNTSISSVDSVGNPLIIASSTDGVNWSTAYNPGYVDDNNGRASVSTPITKLGGIIYIGLGDGSMAKSTDGVTWTKYSSSLTGVNTNGIRDLIVAGNNLVCSSVQTSGMVSFYYSSDDGVTWNHAFDDVDGDFYEWRVFGKDANAVS